jgi:hypothetical protein
MREVKHAGQRPCAQSSQTLLEAFGPEATEYPANAKVNRKEGVL